MKFGEYLDSGKPIIVIVGASKVGKTSIAKHIQGLTGGQLLHARDFYRDVIVPSFLELTNTVPSGTFREQTVLAADYFYERDSAMMVSFMRKHVEVVREPFILESCRVLGDVKELSKHNVVFVVVEASDDVRVDRFIDAKDDIDGIVDESNALELLKFNDQHYKVDDTVNFAKSFPGAKIIDASGSLDSSVEQLGDF